LSFRHATGCGTGTGPPGQDAGEVGTPHESVAEAIGTVGVVAAWEGRAIPRGVGPGHGVR
jgi:hypothetical protein